MRQLLTDPKRATALLVVYTLASSAVLLLNFKNLFAYVAVLAALLIAIQANVPRWLKLAVGALVLGVVLPLNGSVNSAFMNLTIMIAINATLALGLNLVVGFAGLLDLGYVAFFASGAYLWGIFSTRQAGQFLPELASYFPLDGNWFWLFLPVAVLLAAVFGVALGLPVLRLRGDYLAIVTLGFGEIIRILANNLDPITNGPRGLTPIQSPAVGGMHFESGVPMYVVALTLALLTGIAMVRLETSRIGRAWAAMREDEIAARAAGIPLVKMKLIAFATGASFAGAMGMVFAANQTFINPQSFTFLESIGFLAMVILGGLGSIAGVILGAASITILKLQALKDLSNFFTLTLALPREYDISKYQSLIFGAILILMMIFRRDGLLPARRPKLLPDTAPELKGAHQGVSAAGGEC